MKDSKVYFSQIYDEGFGTTFYQKPLKVIKKIKNNKVEKTLSMLLKIIYTIFIFAFSFLLFILTYPF